MTVRATRGNETLQAVVRAAQNGVVNGQALITDRELAALTAQIASGALPVWKVDDGTSLDALARSVDAMPMLPAEKRAVKDALAALGEIGDAHATSDVLGARFRSLWARAKGRVDDAASTAAHLGGVARQLVVGPAKLTDADVDAARAGGAKTQAAALHRLIAPFSDVETRGDVRRAQIERLLNGMAPEAHAALRAAYIEAHGDDPLLHILGTSFAQPLLTSRIQGSLNLTDLARRFVTTPGRGFENVEAWAVKTYQEIVRAPETPARASERAAVQALVDAWLAPELTADAALIAGLVDKAARGEPLSVDERKTYYARMPFIGVRTKADRPHNVATAEQVALERAWRSLGRDDDVHAAMATIEAALPTPPVAQKAEGQRAVAVVVSSQGAQWQELMGYVMEMQRHGVHVQLFTPEGRPAAFQKDSLSVGKSGAIGYGAPAELDPAGPTGMVAKALLGEAQPARAFRAEDFDQVYVAGGLGLNEDGVRVESKDEADRRAGTQHGPASVYEAHDDMAAMVNAAAARGTPLLAICHGPSTFIAKNVALDVAGTQMAALGPFEAYVAFTGRTSAAFPHMALVHHDARAAGVVVDPVRDALKPSGVVRDTARTTEGREIVLVTGPHPASASTLGRAGLELLGIEAEKAQYLVDDR